MACCLILLFPRKFHRTLVSPPLGKFSERNPEKDIIIILCAFWVLFILVCIGRKSGKGCYVYSGRKGKNKAVNQEAEKLMEKYRIPMRGRYVPLSFPLPLSFKLVVPEANYSINPYHPLPPPPHTHNNIMLIILSIPPPPHTHTYIHNDNIIMQS